MTTSQIECRVPKNDYNLENLLLALNVWQLVAQGNVALDCARILLRSTEELATTDIAEHALVQLRESRIRCTLTSPIPSEIPPCNSDRLVDC